VNLRWRLLALQISGPALVLRCGAPLVALLAASVTAAGYSNLATTRLAGAVGIMALIGLLQPKEPVPTVTLGLLVAQYAVATRALSASSRVGTCVLEVVALYLVHSLYGVAAGVPVRAAVDRAVGGRLLRRIAAALAIAVPLAAATAAIGRHAPSVEWLGLLGILAAIGLGALPVVLLRRR